MLKISNNGFTIKPKDVRNKRISKQTLLNIKKRTRKNKMKYKSKNAIGDISMLKDFKL